MQSGTAEARCTTAPRVGRFTVHVYVGSAHRVLAACPVGCFQHRGGGWTAADGSSLAWARPRCSFPWSRGAAARRSKVGRRIDCWSSRGARGAGDLSRRGDRGPVSMPLTGSLLARSSQTTDARTVSKLTADGRRGTRPAACRDIVWDHVGIVSDVWQNGQSTPADLAEVALCAGIGGPRSGRDRCCPTAAGFGPPVAPARRDSCFYCTDVTRPDNRWMAPRCLNKVPDVPRRASMPGAPFSRRHTVALAMRRATGGHRPSMADRGRYLWPTEALRSSGSATAGDRAAIALALPIVHSSTADPMPRRQIFRSPGSLASDRRFCSGTTLTSTPTEPSSRWTRLPREGRAANRHPMVATRRST